MRLYLLLAILTISSCSLYRVSKLPLELEQRRVIASTVSISSVLVELEKIEINGEYNLEAESIRIKNILASNKIEGSNDLLELFKNVLSKSNNLERTYKLLSDSGLKDQLIEFDIPDPQRVQTLTWWLNKEPLKSNRLTPPRKGEVTARDLGIRIVNHGAADESAYNSIINSLDGHPNAFISRKKISGELAQKGEGFYTLKGDKPVAGIMHRPNIKMILNPDAVEGRDFKVSSKFKLSNGEEIVEILILNKKAVRIIHPDSSCSETLKNLIRIK